MLMEKMIRQRLDRVTEEMPERTVQTFISHGIYGDWGLVIIMDTDGTPDSYWFLETSCTWMRPEAIEQYNTYAATGYGVTVAVPEDVLKPMTERLVAGGANDSIHLQTLRDIGVVIDTLPPAPYRAEFPRPIKTR